MKRNGAFEKLWEDKVFVSKLAGIVLDEAHCLSSWGGFRPEYRDIGQLRGFLPDIVIYATSATLSKNVLRDVQKTLGLNSQNTVYYHRSNDRPNVFLGVHRMEHPVSSFKDLDFLLPKAWEEGDPIPPKFLIFFDNITQAQDAAKYLRAKLPAEYRNKIKWFHSVMTDGFRADEVQNMIDSNVWGLCVTDSFGMVSVLKYIFSSMDLYAYRSCYRESTFPISSS